MKKFTQKYTCKHCGTEIGVITSFNNLVDFKTIDCPLCCTPLDTTRTYLRDRMIALCEDETNIRLSEVERENMRFFLSWLEGRFEDETLYKPIM